jgi:hypothetical protein
MAGSIIYTALNAYVTRFTIFWPLTIGLTILVFVIFIPGGLLSVIDQRIRSLPKKGNTEENQEAEKAPSPGRGE